MTKALNDIAFVMLLPVERVGQREMGWYTKGKNSMAVWASLITPHEHAQQG